MKKIKLFLVVVQIFFTLHIVGQETNKNNSKFSIELNSSVQRFNPSEMESLLLNENQRTGGSAYFFSSGVNLQIHFPKILPGLNMSLGTQTQFFSKEYTPSTQVEIYQRLHQWNLGYSMILQKRISINPYLGIRLVNSRFTSTTSAQNSDSIEEFFAGPADSYRFKLLEQIFLSGGIQMATPLKTSVYFLPQELGFYADYMQSLNQPLWQAGTFEGREKNMIPSAFQLGIFLRWNIVKGE